MGLLVYICCLGLFLFVNYKKNGFNAGSFLIFLYFLSSILAFILIVHYKQYEITDIDPQAAVFHCFCLFMFIYPLTIFSNKDISKIRFPHDYKLNLFSWFLISFCVLSLAYSIPRVQYAFSFSDLTEARKLYNDRELFDQEGGASSNIFSYFGSIGHNFSFISLFFFFIYLSFLREYKTIRVLLFFSSFAIVFSNLSAMGRDGIVRWVLFFFFCFNYFKVYLSVPLRKRIFNYGLFASIPLLVIFLAISFFRFSGREQPVLYYLVSYGGQQYFNFSAIYKDFTDGAFGGTLTFPIFFPSSERTLMTNLNDTIYSNISLNTFPTFLGSFYLDTGFLTTLLISILFFLFSMTFLNLSRRKSFSSLIAYLIFCQILLQGVFYFMFYSPTIVKTLLLIFVFSFLIQFKWVRKFY